MCTLFNNLFHIMQHALHVACMVCVIHSSLYLYYIIFSITHTHTHIYIHTFVCVFMYNILHTYTYIHIHTCIYNARVCVCVSERLLTQSYTKLVTTLRREIYIFACVCVCIHNHIHTFI